ncbi:MAG TPA: hypothetical protein VFG42_11025 [Baekduia sp.]|uniref:hypothetical protein n=1 Tax=Baekduia sp. TaxID=2600305 RepID=UPI002D79A173|nr:hypothetical protein [Baekduia sp.]HET6507310.1 hypothetical protein [Baekduia sp.]
MSTRRRGLWALGATAVVAASAAVALADDPVPIKITANVKVTPNKAGTPRHPQGVKIKADAYVSIPRDVDPPLVQSVDVWFPKDGVYNGRKWPTCSEAALRRSGPSICTPKSVMGKGYAVADADGTTTRPTGTILNGGQKRAYVYVVLQHPARVREPLPIDITKLSGDPKWGYRAHVTIPRNLQIVAGIPLRVDEVHGTIGRGDWIATTHCPSDHKWRYHVETHYSSQQIVKYDGTVACRS